MARPSSLAARRAVARACGGASVDPARRVAGPLDSASSARLPVGRCGVIPRALPMWRISLGAARRRLLPSIFRPSGLFGFVLGFGFSSNALLDVSPDQHLEFMA